ncbi:MAG: hypothetical protein AAFU65_03255 [Pseudomonadota bacterium]
MALSANAADVAIGAIYTDTKKSIQNRLTRLPGKQDLDMIVRCYAHVDKRGDLTPVACYSADPDAERVARKLASVTRSSRLIAPTINGNPAYSGVAYSLRIKRVNREVSVDMWMHHGLSASDSEVDFMGPQLLTPATGLGPSGCDEGIGFVIVKVSKEGLPTGAIGWPDSVDACLSNSQPVLQWYASQIFYPAIRDREPVEGMFAFFVPPEGVLRPGGPARGRLNGVPVGLPMISGESVRQHQYMHVLETPQSAAAALALAPAVDAPVEVPAVGDTASDESGP